MFEQIGQRMSVGNYWITYLACVGASILGIIFFIIASLFKSDFFVLISVLILLGSSIYVRIAQMQRCMAIGWPWQTPWIVFGIGLAITVVSQFAVILALIMLPLLVIVGIADFGFGLLIGCIPSKEIIQPDYDPQAYQDSYADYGAPNFSNKLAAQAKQRNDAAMAKLASDNPIISTSGKRVASVTQTPEAVAPPPRSLGFGRKGVVR
jgi:hypothetical protein